MMSNKYTQLESGIIIPASRGIVTADGLYNVASGLGTGKSKSAHNRWGFDPMNHGELDALYQSNWIAAAIVDEFAADVVREWRTIKSEYAEEIHRAERDYNVPGITQEAVQWARLYGGAGAVMLTNQDLEQPLRMDRVKQGDLRKIVVFDRWDLTAFGDIDTYDLLADDYLRPEYFTLYGGSQRIHRSHIAFFQGAKLPKRQARINLGWGDSELRRVITDINDAVASKGGLAELMQEANLDVLTKDDLFDRLGTDEEEAIVKRYQIFSLMKSTINMALLDSEEKLDRHTLQLSGVAPLLETFMVWIAGASRMPMTKIFGTSASGLNATGEGDRKNYNATISSHQNGQVKDGLRKIDEVVIRSALGFMPDDYDYVWNPLEQQNGVEIAQEQLLEAQKNQIYLDAGIVQKNQIQTNLQSSEQYQFDDKAIEKMAKAEGDNLLDYVDQDDEDESDIEE